MSLTPPSSGCISPNYKSRVSTWGTTTRPFNWQQQHFWPWNVWTYGDVHLSSPFQLVSFPPLLAYFLFAKSHISSFPDVICFSDDRTYLFLPTSLSHLRIIDFQNLKSIASMGLKSVVSLETLVLKDCSRIGSVATKESYHPRLQSFKSRIFLF